MPIEADLKNLIVQKFGTITNFSKATGIPNSTLSSIFQRGVLNANVLNMITICDALAIDIDSLANERIEPKRINVNISLKEQQLLVAYSQHKEFQLAVDTLLGITESPPQRIVQTQTQEPQTFKVKEAARHGQSEEKTLTKECLDFIEANQETEDSEL